MFSHSLARRFFLRTLVLVALPGAAFLARAGEGSSSTVVGKVTARSANSISLLVDEKRNRTQDFAITDQTIIRRAREPVAIEDVDIGEKAGIVVVTEGGQATAAVIELRARR